MNLGLKALGQWISLPSLTGWKATATNPWGFEMEQQFGGVGGPYRHRTFDDNLSPLPWESGPHPIAQRLRDEGKDETDCFRRVRV